MKKQKLLCIFLSILMLITTSISVVGLTSEVASSNPYFLIESTSADRGDEIEVDVSIGNNPGFWAAKFSISCDKELSFVENDIVSSISNASVTTNFKNNVFTCLIDSETSSNITYNGTLFTLKFKVDDNAFVGKYNIRFTNNLSSNFINYNVEKVAFEFVNGVVSVGEGYVFEAKNCSPKASSGATVSTYSQTDLAPTATLSTFTPVSTGDYVTYTLSNVAAGKYTLNTYSRDYTSRGSFDIYVNGTLIKTQSYAADFAMYIRKIGDFSVSTTGTVTIKFVANEVGTLYLKSFELVKKTDSVSTTTSLTTTTTTTTTKKPTSVTTTSNTTTTVMTQTSKNTLDVYIDGVLVESLAKGSIFTLPEDSEIVAYKDLNKNYYACGSQTIVDNELKLTSVKISLKTLEQASMRLKSDEVEKNISGIRFYTEVDAEAISELRENGFQIELGTLIAPKNYFDNKKVTDLKFGVDFGKNINYLNVPYDSDCYYQDDEFTGIVGSIININLNHSLWNFVGRGYAKVNYNGVEKIIYAEGKKALPERSICYIAYMLKNDFDSYEYLYDDQKRIVDFYAVIYKDPITEDNFD